MRADEARWPDGPGLPAAVQAGLFLARPLEFLRWCQRRHGDVFTLRLTGFGRVVYLADPGAIQDLFRADGDLGEAGSANVALEPVTGPGSLLRLEGADHLAERRRLMPAFHGRAVARLRDVIEEAAGREVCTWPVDEPFAVRPAMQRITFEVITRAVLGVDDDELRAELLELLGPLFDVPLSIMVPALRVDLGPASPWGSFVRSRQAADDRLYQLITQRRSRPPGDDVLGLLVYPADDRVSDARVRDELVTLLLAGHETTASALAWAFELLAHHPEVVERIRAADTDSYITGVVKETLRVRSVVMDVGRRLLRPWRLGGYRVPAGTLVVPAIWLAHHDGRNYLRPEEFRPQRWLADDAGGPWIPFGGGRRRCLGAALAMTEMQLVLAAVLRHRTPRPTGPPEPPRLRGITLVPARDACLRMVPAAAGHERGSRWSSSRT